MKLPSVIAANEASLREAIMNDAPVTAVVVAENHKIVKVFNEELLTALGYPWPDEVIGKPVEIFLPTDMHAQHVIWFDAWMRDPTARPLRNRLGMKAIRADGEPQSVSIILRKLYLEDGEIFGPDYAGKPFRGGVAHVMIESVIG